jgi:hypothetical protein
MPSLAVCPPPTQLQPLQLLPRSTFGEKAQTHPRKSASSLSPHPPTLNRPQQQKRIKEIHRICKQAPEIPPERTRFHVPNWLQLLATEHDLDLANPGSLLTLPFTPRIPPGRQNSNDTTDPEFVPAAKETAELREQQRRCM